MEPETMPKTDPDLPFSHPVPVATLHGETFLTLSPDTAARVRIAQDLGLDGIDALSAQMKVTHANNGLITIEGQLEARVHPVCVVSLEPFDRTISEPVIVRFAPAGLIEKMTKRAEENGDEDFEPPDEIIEGIIDFGTVVTEFLALSLDPYPRKPDAVFRGGDPVEPKISPFDALKALKAGKQG
jgi:Large ribosomal RNA subunit accumulation protein YceD